jgi:ABC-type sugar transport system ATPase subunit
MRDGQIIGTRDVAGVSSDELVEMMVGREVNSAYPKRDAKIGEEILRVENLCRKDRQQNVAFTLREGEVLGIAGLVGAGRTEIMRAIFGVDYISSMDVYVRGKKVKLTDPAAAKKYGIAFLTEDRKVEGLTLDFTVKSNIVAANLKSFRKGLFNNNKIENEIADTYIAKTRIKTPHRNQKVGNLSGGNQQKVVVSKWLNTDPDILIMDEPTRGIDVGAKREIYEIINDLVSQGKAIILISSELPEVLGMSDRVLVMKDDVIVAELTGDDINAVEVMRHAL